MDSTKYLPYGVVNPHNETPTEFTRVQMFYVFLNKINSLLNIKCCFTF